LNAIPAEDVEYYAIGSQQQLCKKGRHMND
jgi:hypothetical protein